MSTILAGDATTFPDQTAPVAGEPRTQSSVETPFQNAADRAEYLKDRLTFIDPNKEGVRRVRTFASTTALKASVDVPNGTICKVAGIGIYEYISLSEAIEALPVVVKPTSVGAGPGAWLLAGFGAFNVANGIPQLNGSGKLPGTRLDVCSADGRVDGAKVHNGIVSIVYGYEPGDQLTTSTTYQNLSTPQLSVNALNGDMIEITGKYRTAITATKKGETRIVVVNPDATITEVDGSETVVVDPDVGSNGFSHMYPVNADGLYVVKFQHRIDPISVGTITTHHVVLIAKVYRQ